MNELQEKLEALIDQHGLAAVIEASANICFEKAAHIRENWQDHTLADVWHKNSNKVNALVGKLEPTY